MAPDPTVPERLARIEERTAATQQAVHELTAAVAKHQEQLRQDCFQHWEVTRSLGERLATQRATLGTGVKVALGIVTILALCSSALSAIVALSRVSGSP